MRLYYSPTSPYVRKVTALLIETGLEGRVERVPTNVWDPSSDIGRVNPLAKVPTLITDDGQVLVESVVICEYLDSLPHGQPNLFPRESPARWAALSLHGIADGILDAGISRFLEMRRPEGERSYAWMERQSGKVQRGLDWLEAAVDTWQDPPTIGHITVACLLAWLDFRFPGEDWRSDRTRLAAWYEVFAARPAMLATVPQDI